MTTLYYIDLACPNCKTQCRSELIELGPGDRGKVECANCHAITPCIGVNHRIIEVPEKEEPEE